VGDAFVTDVAVDAIDFMDPAVRESVFASRNDTISGPASTYASTRPPVDHVARERHDVGDRLVPAVLHADIRHVRIVRDPHLATRPRCRPAELVGLLEQTDVCAALAGGDGRRQAGGAGAKHDHIERFSCHEPILSGRRRRSSTPFAHRTAFHGESSG
jgi:hypothetical protein